MGVAKYLWGPHTRDGVTAALITAMLDQASKLWLLFAYGLAAKGPVKILPVADLILTWNKGISYGLLQQDSALGQWVLFAVKVAASIFLWAWLSQAATRLTALSLGLIIGGAAGNAVDRLAHGA